MKTIRDEGITQVDLKTTDIWGRWHHVTLANTYFSEKTFTEGVGFDASNLGYANVVASDLLMVPDPNTAFLEDFNGEKVLSIICDVYDVDSGKYSPLDPRSILRNTISSISDVAENAMLAPEYEFHVFNSVKFDVTSNEIYYVVDSEEGFWNSGKTGTYTIGKKGGYEQVPPFDSMSRVRAEIVDELLKLGVPVKYHHHEVGTCQVEIELSFTDALRAADYAMLVKYVARNVARKMGYVVSFMPKPLFEEAGNGMHVHQYLVRNGVNIFSGQELFGLSSTALSYIAGLLTHGKSVMAFTNPSTNSYRRLTPGFEAPTSAVFGLGNRTAAIRIPAYVKDPGQRRIEFRTIDATTNPYLGFAAMILAGVDGIRRSLDPISLGYGPVEDTAEGKGEMLATSLTEACKALKDDHSYLSVFPDALLENWVEKKIKEELTVSRVPSPEEFKLYFDL
jgi:glutamine synthetase